MAPVIKDTVEVPNSVTDLAGSRVGTPAKPSGGQMRADALSLEVPVKVHGSRVTEVVRGVTPHTEPFEEQSSTMIVFPQGAVLRMATAVNVGQMLVLTNLKTRQDAICRVVKVRSNANLQGYVEVEFTHKQPGYWGAQFASDGTTLGLAGSVAQPARVAPSAAKPAAISSVPASKPIVGSPATKEATPLPPPASATPAKPDSAFVSFGAQENVQPPASATVSTKSPAVPLTAKDFSSAESSFEMPATLLEPPAPSSGLSMADLRGDRKSGIEADLAAALSGESEDDEPALKGIASAEVGSKARPVEIREPEAVPESHVAPAERLRAEPAAESSDKASDVHLSSGVISAAESHRSWLLPVMGIVVLFVAGAAGVLYFRARSEHSAPNAAVSNPPAAATPSPEASPVTTAEPVTVVPKSVASAKSSTAANTIPSVSSSPVAAQPKASAAVAVEPRVVPRQAAPLVSKDVMSASLAAHPVAAQHGAPADSDAAPALDPSAVAADQSAALPDVIPSSNAISVPVPEIQPSAAAKVGGQVTEPKLVSYFPPVYPQTARSAGIEGDVVVRTTIDKNGRVTGTQVVSGPVMLREPALQALRRWKYEPSKLDGQPVSVQVVVTLKFRR